MTEQQQLLWEKISAFEVSDPDDSFTFCQRLARENAWSLDYAKDVFMEYKKFVFLCVAADHPMTPSDEVDQAWHLHLQYTRSYWEELCNGILKTPLHHTPTRGGESESVKFRHWYEYTIQTYTAFFNSPPPSNIWPHSLIRFNTTKNCRRLDMSHYFLLPRQLIKKTLHWTAIILFSIIGLTACSQLIENPYSLAFFIFVFVAIMTIIVQTCNCDGDKSPRDKNSGSNSGVGWPGGACSSDSGGGCSGGGCSGCGGCGG